MAASSGVAVDATFSFASPFPAAKDRSFPLVHNTIPIRTADENRFTRISPATPAPFRRDLRDAQLVTKFDEIVRVPRLSRRTMTSGDAARKQDESAATARSRSEESPARSKLQRHEDAIRIVHVIAERFAVGESIGGIELASRPKSSH